MSYVLILGGSRPNSLGWHIVGQAVKSGLIPIIVGRSAGDATEGHPGGTIYIQADLTDTHVGETVIDQIPDLDSVSHLVIAGGGPHLKGPITLQNTADVSQLWQSITIGPMLVVAAFHKTTSHAYHLTTVASTSAVRVRADETWYASAQAARRALALNFHAELSQHGGRSTIVCPGGMKTNLWADSDLDTSTFMDPNAVAAIIWETLNNQKERLIELTINRGDHGNPIPATSAIR